MREICDIVHGDIDYMEKFKASINVNALVGPCGMTEEGNRIIVYTNCPFSSMI